MPVLIPELSAQANFPYTVCFQCKVWAETCFFYRAMVRDHGECEVGWAAGAALTHETEAYQRLVLAMALLPQKPHAWIHAYTPVEQLALRSQEAPDAPM